MKNSELLRDAMGIRSKANAYAWCGTTVDQLKVELDQAMVAGLAVPVEPGGWWHQYVCPQHHTELLFDPLIEDVSVYSCPHGCSWKGEPYRGAWLVFKHQAMARYILQSAAVYAATGEKSYADYAKEWIMGYALQFPHYPVHPDSQPWMLKGRAFHQALTEAIWATTLLRGYLLLRDEGVAFTADESQAIDEFLRMLEGSMTEYHQILTQERGNPENNYTAWLLAALFCIYAARGDTAKLTALLEADGGLRHHLSIAIRADQLEFEGSVYYHIFVLRAYLIAAEMGARLGQELYTLQGDDGQSIEGMLSILVSLADCNGMLPALHDGPYRRGPYAREIAEILEIGFSRYKDPKYLPLLANVYRELNHDEGRCGMLEALLYGQGEWDGRLKGLEKMADSSEQHSLLLPHSGFAVLRTGEEGSDSIRAMVDYGPHGGAHGHFDKLNLMLHAGQRPLSPDRGTVPYGSVLKKEWYPHTACHNTVSIAGRSQLPAEGECKNYEATSHRTYTWLRSEQAYNQGTLDRHLMLTEEWLLDWFEVQVEDPAVIDWWFHYIGRGELYTEYMEEQPLQDIGTMDGYEYVTVKNWYKARHSGTQINLQIHQGSDSVAVASFLSCEGMDYVKVKSPGLADDPSREMEGILLRQTATYARFIAIYRSGDEPVELNWIVDGNREELIISCAGTRRAMTMTNNGLKERIL